MRIHSLLLSSAALVASATVGFAADLPSKKAAPVDYVKVCTIGSFTGFVIPGSDVCLKIGGFVRYQYGYDSTAHGFFYNNGVGHGTAAGAVFGRGRNIDAGGGAATGSVKLDARTTTEYGLLRSFADMRINSAGGAAVDKAYIQFGPWSFGKFQSFFDFYADGYNNTGNFGSDSSVVGVAYSATITPNFFATIALEDRSKGAFGSPVIGSPGAAVGFGTAGVNGGVAAAGYRVPDVVGQLLYTDAWGSAQLTAAAHQVRVNRAAVVADPAIGLSTLGIGDETKYGFAVQGGLKFNLDMLAKGDTAYLQAAYSEGALSYVGLGDWKSNNATQTVIGQSDAVAVGPGGVVKLTKAFNVLAGFDHFWTPSFDTAIFASYTKVDYASGAFAGENQLVPALGDRGRDFNLFQAGAQATWVPAKGFKVAVTGLYYQIDAKTLASDYVTVAGVARKGVDTSSNGFKSVLRVQRDF